MDDLTFRVAINKTLRDEVISPGFTLTPKKKLNWSKKIELETRPYSVYKPLNVSGNLLFIIKNKD